MTGTPATETWEAFCTKCGWSSSGHLDALAATLARMRHAKERGCPDLNSPGTSARFS